MTDLPTPVRELVEAVNAHDEDAFLDAFPEGGVVDDWGREFVGRDQIKAWSDVEFIGAAGTMDVRQVTREGDRVVVVADWRSTHANGMSEFGFDVADGRVTRLTIRGAD